MHATASLYRLSETCVFYVSRMTAIATAASKIAPPPIRRQVSVRFAKRGESKKRSPHESQVGAEKLLMVRQLGHCLAIRNPLHGSTVFRVTALIARFPSASFSPQDS